MTANEVSMLPVANRYPVVGRAGLHAYMERWFTDNAGEYEQAWWSRDIQPEVNLANPHMPNVLFREYIVAEEAVMTMFRLSH